MNKEELWNKFLENIKNIILKAPLDTSKKNYAIGDTNFTIIPIAISSSAVESVKNYTEMILDYINLPKLISLKNEITKLQAGHINPSKPLELGNIIPQCQVCNRPDRDRWIYDKTGRVIEIADSDDGKRVVEKYFKRVSKSTREYFLDFLKRLLGIK